MANAIAGTLLVTALGALFAVPVGVISGIYVADTARRAWRPWCGSRPTR